VPAAALDPSSAVPLYRQLADDIRERIAAGEWAVDAHLPAEADLAHAYAVGRDTARQAIYSLRDDGVIYRRRGERWRVADKPVPVLNGRRGDRERIVLPRGSVLSARMPSVVELAEGWPADVPVVEVRWDGQTRVFRGDRHDFRPY
jgi:DNA-binding transcriptional regulator YhcF (GntR family)